MFSVGQHTIGRIENETLVLLPIAHHHNIYAQFDDVCFVVLFFLCVCILFDLFVYLDGFGLLLWKQPVLYELRDLNESKPICDGRKNRQELYLEMAHVPHGGNKSHL